MQMWIAVLGYANVDIIRIRILLYIILYIYIYTYILYLIFFNLCFLYLIEYL
jgi:hypothetical protein